MLAHQALLSSTTPAEKKGHKEYNMKQRKNQWVRHEASHDDSVNRSEWTNELYPGCMIVSLTDEKGKRFLLSVRKHRFLLSECRSIRRAIEKS